MSGLALPRLPFRRPPSEGEHLLRANRLPEAEAALVDDASRGINPGKALLAAGHLALMRNDLSLAESRLTRAVASAGRNRDALALLAEVAYRRGDWTAAADYQERAGNGPFAAKIRSFGGDGLYRIEGPANARVAFVRNDPLPILRARIGGGPEADFLLDTGGAEVILDARFAGARGVTATGSERGWFAGGRTARLSHAGVDCYELGEMQIRNLPVQVLDLAGVGATLGVEQLAGIVGTSLLYRFLATIDYPAQALVLRRRGASPPVSANAQEVPFAMADDHFILAEGRLNDGAPMLFFVDTGLAGGAFACPASTLHDAGIRQGANPSVTGRGGGGTVSAWPFDIASLSLGAARREGLHGIAGVFPPQLEREFGFRIGGLISHDFLRAYAVTIDFDRMVISLDRPREAERVETHG